MSEKRIPIILDTDIGMDIDDTWALALLLKSPELDPKLITTASGDTIYRAKIVAKILDAAGRVDIPIGIGPSDSGPYHDTQDDWVADFKLSSYPGVVHEDGIGALIDTVKNAQQRITVISIGPLMNLAEAIRREPRITQKANLVGMLGSIRIGYGGKPKPQREYNVLRSPGSCQVVFEAPWEIAIAPLDVCGNITLSGDNYKRIYNSDDPTARALIENSKIWAKNSGYTRLFQEETSILFDTVAIYLAFSGEFLNIEELGIEVTNKGKTVINDTKKKIRCTTSWNDEPAFKRLIATRLAG